MIDDSAFERCTSLTSIIVQNPIPPKVNNKFHTTFAGINMDRACLYVPIGSILAYRYADGWKEFECIKDIALVPKN